MEVSGGGASWTGLFVREAVTSIAGDHSPTNYFVDGAQEIVNTCQATSEGFVVGVAAYPLPTPFNGYCWPPGEARPAFTNGFYDTLGRAKTTYVLNQQVTAQGYIDCKHEYKVGTYTFPDWFENK